MDLSTFRFVRWAQKDFCVFPSTCRDDRLFGKATMTQHELYRKRPPAPNPGFVQIPAQQKCVGADRQSDQNVSRETVLSDWTLKSDKTCVWHITVFLRKQWKLRLLPRGFGRRTSHPDFPWLRAIRWFSPKGLNRPKFSLSCRNTVKVPVLCGTVVCRSAIFVARAEPPSPTKDLPA